ncbi:MAG: tetratricopeptide repeat protein [Bacteroidota bacterium]
MATPPRKPAQTAKTKTASVKTQTSKAQASKVPAFQIPEFIANTRLLSLVLFGFAFLLYANTLTHGYTLDDDIVIKQNMYTQQGVAGIPGILSKDTFFGYFKVEGKETLVSGGRYRPFTLVLFALTYQIFGDNSFVFHLLTVLLFALSVVLLYQLLLALFKPSGSDYAALLAFLTAALFAAHPIHTEVVANIKGCDEIVTLLGCMAGLLLTVKAFDNEKMLTAWLGAGVYFLACLSKENAASFVLVTPLALWFFRSATSSQIVRYSTPTWAAFLVFFIIRGSILDWHFGGAPMELMNNPFLKIVGNQWVAASVSEKFATIFYTLGKYVMLLFVPHPLTHDYYPRTIELLTFSDPKVLLSLVLYGFLGWYVLSGITKKDPVRFGILFYLITLSIVSNIVFPIGTNMGERFAFMPSVGFCLVIGTILTGLWKNGNSGLVYGIVGAALVLFSLKTLTRNPVWASNEKLFLTDVAVSGNSAKIRNACGGILLDKAAKEKDEVTVKSLSEQSLAHLNKAIEIYPNYKDAYISRGGAQFLLKNYEASVADYRMAAKLGQEDPKPKSLLAMALRESGKVRGEQKGDLPGALKFLTEAWELNPKDAETARLFGVANGIQGKKEDALTWFQRAVDLSPNNASYLYDLGTAYYIMGDATKGAEFRGKAIQLDPKLDKGQQGGK